MSAQKPLYSEQMEKGVLYFVALGNTYGKRYGIQDGNKSKRSRTSRRSTMFGYKVKLPELSAQREIVARILELQDKAEEIAHVQLSADRELQNFEAALLAKAFRSTFGVRYG